MGAGTSLLSICVMKLIDVLNHYSIASMLRFDVYLLVPDCLNVSSSTYLHTYAGLAGESCTKI